MIDHSALMKTLGICIAALALFGPAASVAADSPSACGQQAEILRRTVETDYIGYRLAQRNAPEIAERMTEAGRRLLVEASLSDARACQAVLWRYLDVFDDPHLFLLDTPFDAPELFAVSAPSQDVRSAAIAAAVDDPIFGVWFDGRREIAIAPGPLGGILGYDLQAADGEPPRLAARFERTSAGYVATVRAADGKAVRYRARIQKNLMLHMAPLTWSRRAPLDERQASFVSSTTPRAPTFAKGSDAISIISAPSFSPEQDAALDALVRQFRAEIEQSALLIIDIRGNEGGSASVGDRLAPFYIGDSAVEPAASRRGAVILSSESLGRYVARMIERLPDGDYRSFLVRLSARLDAHPGELVPYGVDERDWALLDPQESDALPAPGPARVAILTDEDVVSAGEAFLLSAGRSSKVTIFGANSAGSIDYESVYMTTLSTDVGSLRLGMPSVASSDALPLGGFNAEGVPVDVRLDPASPDVLEQIAAYYGL